MESLANHANHVNRLVCLAKDPHTLFCYWRFTPARINSLEELTDLSPAEMKFTLRAYGRQPGEGSPAVLQEHTLPSISAGRYYLTNLAAATYSLELGLTAPDGQYIAILRAPEVKLPPERPARPDEAWLPEAGEDYFAAPALVFETAASREPDGEPPGPAVTSPFNWS